MAMGLNVHKGKLVSRRAAPCTEFGDKPQLLEARKSAVHGSYAQLETSSPGAPMDLFSGQVSTLVTAQGLQHSPALRRDSEILSGQLPFCTKENATHLLHTLILM